MLKDAECHVDELITRYVRSLRSLSCISCCCCADSLNYRSIFSCLSPYVHHVSYMTEQMSGKMLIVTLFAKRTQCFVLLIRQEVVCHIELGSIHQFYAVNTCIKKT